MSQGGSSGKRIKAAYDGKQRVAMAKEGLAIPIIDDAGEILDGSCPIATREDLARAIGNFPRTSGNPAVKAHIIKRAKELEAVQLLPRSLTATRKRRGRPVGSISLTRELEDRILGLIRAGVFDHVAAGVVGISPRTLREWMARGEGRSKRPSTPKLQAFAKKYRQAKAEARALAEARAYQEDYKMVAHARSAESRRTPWMDGAGRRLRRRGRCPLARRAGGSDHGDPKRSALQRSRRPGARVPEPSV